MNSTKHMELLLFAACWWYLVLDGNIVTAYYSRNILYNDPREEGSAANDFRHLISSEAVMLTGIISESVCFLKMLVNNEKKSSDNNEPGISREISNPEFLNAITAGLMDRTCPVTHISNFI